jgi:hypothetical protein
MFLFISDRFQTPLATKLKDFPSNIDKLDNIHIVAPAVMPCGCTNNPKQPRSSSFLKHLLRDGLSSLRDLQVDVLACLRHEHLRESY